MTTTTRTTMDNVHPALAACFHPVCRSSDVARGQRSSGRRCSAQDWAVARIDGAVVALVDRCPHRCVAAERRLRRRRRDPVRVPRLPLRRRRPLRRDPGARRWRRRSRRRRTRVPAALASSSATGWSGSRPRSRVTGIIDVPEWDDPGVRRRPAARSDRGTPGPAQMVDNFLDLAHFPFTHAGTFGDPDDIEVPAYTVERDGLGVHVRLPATRRSCSPTRWEPRSSRSPSGDRLVVRGAVRDPPAASSTPADDVVLTILFFHQPVDAHDHQAVLLRPAQRHRRRPHHRRGDGRVPARRRRRGPRRCSSACVNKAVPLDLPRRGAHPGRPDHPRDAPGPARPRARRGGPIVTAVQSARTCSPGPLADAADAALAWVARWSALGSPVRCGSSAAGPAGRSGMVVTPAEAVEPIVGTTRDLYGRATAATVWAAARGLLIGGGLAFFAALAAVTMPSMRRAISRLAAIANAAPWVAVAPCLLVVLGRDRGPTAVAAIAVFFYVFVVDHRRPRLGRAQLARRAHRARRAAVVPACAPSSCRAAGRRCSTGSSSPPRRRSPARSSASGTAPAAGLGVLLIGAMQAGRADRLWAASLLSAGCGLTAFAAVRARPPRPRRPLRRVGRPRSTSRPAVNDTEPGPRPARWPPPSASAPSSSSPGTSGSRPPTSHRSSSPGRRVSGAT